MGWTLLYFLPLIPSLTFLFDSDSFLFTIYWGISFTFWFIGSYRESYLLISLASIPPSPTFSLIQALCFETAGISSELPMFRPQCFVFTYILSSMCSCHLFGVCEILGIGKVGMVITLIFPHLYLPIPLLTGFNWKKIKTIFKKKRNYSMKNGHTCAQQHSINSSNHFRPTVID